MRFFLRLTLCIFTLNTLTTSIQASGDPETTVTFEYMGDTLTYGVVEFNGRLWMDRNLGAQRAARTYKDPASYGDLFQWGREADGHQNSFSRLTDTLANKDQQPGHDAFIINSQHPYDWNEDPSWQNRSWSDRQEKKTEYDPCPAGWRVPNEYEWKDFLESGIETLEDAFNSPLKLPSSGFRNHYGEKFAEGAYGFYWSSTPMGVSGMYMSFYDKVAYMNYGNRADGFSIRCIKEQ